MRENKFRGRRTENDEWVYGCLCKAFGGYSIMPNCFFGTQIFDEDEISNRYQDGLAFGGWFSVIPESVGQFTGEQDLNGVDIYEGDKVVYKKEVFDADLEDLDLIEYVDVTGTVVFENGSFQHSESNFGWEGENYINLNECIVI